MNPNQVPRTTDAPPPVLILVGVFMLAMAIWAMKNPERSYHERELSKHPDTRRGRLWNWWVKTGFWRMWLIFGGLLVVTGTVRLVQ